jgi:hypothetical protein
MPQFVVIALAVSAAANVAGLGWLLAARPRQADGAWRTNFGWLVGVPLGIYLGCVILGEWPQWPPMNDRQRVLAQLLPLVIVVEVIVALAAKPWLAVLLRGAAAAAIAPLLLSQSIYLADLAGPGSAEWSAGEASLILLGIAALIAVDWLALSKLQQRTSDRSIAALLALINLSAGMAVVMSGYLRGGLVGLPWAGALVGAAVATHWGPDEQRGGSQVGIGLLGVAYVLLVGYFFGALDTTVGLVIAASPLLAWIAELPAGKSWPEARRAAFRWGVVALPLVIVLAVLGVKFVRAISEDPLL